MVGWEGLGSVGMVVVRGGGERLWVRVFFEVERLDAGRVWGMRMEGLFDRWVSSRLSTHMHREYLPCNVSNKGSSKVLIENPRKQSRDSTR